jgi:aminoglycoside adenylyltransferase-like protein
VVDVDRYVAAVQDDWPDGKVAYRVLTVCRLLRSLDSRSICSKEEGAEWAATRYSDWAPLIRAAWDVRRTGERRRFTRAERASLPRLLAGLAREATARRR